MTLKDAIKEFMAIAVIPDNTVVFRTSMQGDLLARIGASRIAKTIKVEVPEFSDFVEKWGDLVALSPSGEIESLWWGYECWKKNGGIKDLKDLVSQATITGVLDMTEDIQINDGTGSVNVILDNDANNELCLKTKGVASLMLNPGSYNQDNLGSWLSVIQAMVPVDQDLRQLKWSLARWAKNKSLANAFRLGGEISTLTPAVSWMELLSALTMTNIEPSELFETRAFLDPQSKQLLSRKTRKVPEPLDAFWSKDKEVVPCFERDGWLDPLAAPNDEDVVRVVTLDEFGFLLASGTVLKMVMVGCASIYGEVPTELQEPLKGNAGSKLLEGDGREMVGIFRPLSDVTDVVEVAAVEMNGQGLENLVFHLLSDNFDEDAFDLRPSYFDLVGDLKSHRDYFVNNATTVIDGKLSLCFQPFTNDTGESRRTEIYTFGVFDRGLRGVRYIVEY